MRKKWPAQGQYFGEDIVEGRHKQGFGFLVKLQGHGVLDSTWEPIKAFVLDGGHFNEVFAKFCLDHQARYNTALKKHRQLSQRMGYQKQKKNNEKQVVCKSSDEKDLSEALEEPEGLPEIQSEAAKGRKKA